MNRIIRGMDNIGPSIINPINVKEISRSMARVLITGMRKLEAI
jgi:hypothetical protein